MKSRTQLVVGDVSAATPRNATTGSFRWVILLVIWAAFMVSCVDRFAWASIAAPVGHALGFKLALLGSLTTAFYVGYTVSCPVGGILADKFGSRATLVFSLICFCVIRNTPDGQSVPRITAVQIASLLKNRNLLLLALGGAGAL